MAEGVEEGSARRRGPALLRAHPEPGGRATTSPEPASGRAGPRSRRRDALAPYLGFRWSKANFSAAERSVDGQRVRQFDADEIVAFARTFDLPVSWFFMPPPPWASPGMPTKLRTPDAERFGSPLALLADLVFGDDQARALLTPRLRAFLEELGPNPLTDAQHRVTELVARQEGASSSTTPSATSAAGRPSSELSPTTSKTSNNAPRRRLCRRWTNPTCRPLLDAVRHHVTRGSILGSA